MRNLRTLGSAASIATVVGIGVTACDGPSDDEGVTFAKTIEPLVQEKCQRCHREGGIAPFALTTYEDLKRIGTLAKEKVVSREMPPWGAFDDDKCKVRFPYKDDLRLTDDEVQTFAKWVDDGMREGDMSKRPAPKTFPPDGLPNKTHTFKLAKPYEVVGGGKDDIRCFPIDPGFAEPTWIGGSNVMPGDPRVVHHVIVYTDPQNQAAAKAGEVGSYPCFGGPQVDQTSLLLAWAPGVPPTIYGESTGLKLEAGSKLVAQVHYHPAASSAMDQTAFELEVLGHKPGYVAQVILFGNAESANSGVQRLLPGPGDPATGPAFVIPANASAHTETMELDIPTKFGDFDVPAMSVAAAGSHMHWAGVDLKMEIERKTPTPEQPAKECLVGTPKYDFNWQRWYTYDAPVEGLPVVNPGDKLKLTCTYNNTTSNKYVVKAMSEQRLGSPVDLHLGETTLDEMCVGVIITVRRAGLLD